MYSNSAGPARELALRSHTRKHGLERAGTAPARLETAGVDWCTDKSGRCLSNRELEGVKASHQPRLERINEPISSRMEFDSSRTRVQDEPTRLEMMGLDWCIDSSGHCLFGEELERVRARYSPSVYEATTEASSLLGTELQRVYAHEESRRRDSGISMMDDETQRSGRDEALTHRCPLQRLLMRLEKRNEEGTRSLKKRATMWVRRRLRCTREPQVPREVEIRIMLD